MDEYFDINKTKLEKSEVVRKKAMRFHNNKKRKNIQN